MRASTSRASISDPQRDGVGPVPGVAAGLQQHPHPRFGRRAPHRSPSSPPAEPRSRAAWLSPCRASSAQLLWVLA